MKVYHILSDIASTGYLRRESTCRLYHCRFTAEPSFSVRFKTRLAAADGSSVGLGDAGELAAIRNL